MFILFCIKLKVMISELSINSKKLEIVAKVVEKRQPREVNTKFGRKLVTDAILEDQTGQITLVLWEADIDKVKEGDTVKIMNGYVTEWNGSLQVNVGRLGSIEVL